MSGRQILPPVFLSLLGLFLSFGLGQSGVSTTGRSDVQAVAFSSAIEPAGANRCKVCHSANHCRNSAVPRVKRGQGEGHPCALSHKFAL